MKFSMYVAAVLALALLVIACRRPGNTSSYDPCNPCDPCGPSVVVSRRVVRPAGAGQALPVQPVSDQDLSLLRGSVFGTPVPDAVKWNDAMPGSNAKVPHLFEGAPPAVPHGIDDFLPITLEENGCLECHFSADEDPEEVPQLPASHLTDLREAPDRVGDGVAGSRYTCVLCHVPLSDAKPLPELAPDEK